MNTGNPLIVIDQIDKTYTMGSNQVLALRDVSLTINSGEFVAVMGPSGSGKSTFLNLLGCLDRPTAGRYILNGSNVSELNDNDLSMARSQNLGFVFQSFNLLSKLTARGNIELPLMYASHQHGAEYAEQLLELVGLTDRAHHRPNELSGGQQQRVAIARSLINAPPVLLADEPTGNLDSVTGREIMAILTGLHRCGLTIIIVTHEEEVAAYANRIIRFRDGRLQSDTSNPRPVSLERSSEIQLPRYELSAYMHARRGVSFKEIKDNLKSAFASLWQNRMRAFLTVLGILIGVGAVIAMVSVGQGTQAQVRAQIEGLGSNLLSIVPGSTSSNGPIRDAAGTQPTLTYDDALAVRSLPDVLGVAPELTSRKQVKYGRSNWNTMITGTTPEYPSVHNWLIKDGEFFTEDDNRSNRSVAVLGSDTAAKLFDTQDPIGQTIRIDNFPYHVLGVMEAKGSGGFFSRDDFILLPLNTAYHKMSGQKNVRSIAVQVVDKEHIPSVQAALGATLRERHKLYSETPDDFTITSQDDIMATVEGVTNSMTLMLASIAGISLLVGGIGIMNIMLVSVTERTREIGIRKALGARSIDIMLQFLIEAMVLSLIGGILGVALGMGAAQIISVVGKTTTVITLPTVLVALLFSLAIGMFFGIYPASKASKMDPIQALRYD